MSKRRIVCCVAAVAILLAVAGAMLVIGRGHTVYFDNATMEYEGTEYTALHKVQVYVDGERVANLAKRERGMAATIGQNFSMTLNVTAEKGGAEAAYKVNLNLPYNMDGIIVNIPALLAGLPQDAWCSEFIQTVVEEDPADEEVPGGDDGLDGGLDEGLDIGEGFDV